MANEAALDFSEMTLIFIDHCSKQQKNRLLVFFILIIWVFKKGTV
jgi:hypothetical protein